MTVFSNRVTPLVLVLLAVVLAACAGPPAVQIPVAPDPLGDFKLGFVVVVADKVQKGPLSRDASQAELIAALKPKLDRSFAAYTGTKFYNLGVSIDSYVLAIPGIPIVASPSSILIVTLSVWDDAKQKMILDEPKQFTILEKISGKSFFGSGLTQNKEQQLDGLTDSAVRQIEKFMRDNISLFQNAETPAPKS